MWTFAVLGVEDGCGAPFRPFQARTLEPPPPSLGHSLMQAAPPPPLHEMPVYLAYGTSLFSLIEFFRHKPQNGGEGARLIKDICAAGITEAPSPVRRAPTWGMMLQGHRGWGREALPPAPRWPPRVGWAAIPPPCP